MSHPGAQTIDTDVVVIGGGVAGCLAAIGAREMNARVAVVDKGGLLERCGSIAAGVDQILAVAEDGCDWDTPEYLLQHVPKLTDFIVDMKPVETFVRGLPAMLRKLEKMGVPFKDPTTGKYFRHRTFGLPGEYHIDFDGSKFKPKISRAVLDSGAQIFLRAMAVNFLTRKDQTVGASVFHIRTGEFYFFRAKAIVLATGDTNRLSRNSSGLAFDSWHCPYNTGDAQAMAARHGVLLANMEFTENTITPKGISSQGTNSLTGLGAHFINAKGERFMLKYDPAGERARRDILTSAIVSETLAGNAPIYCDCRHLPANILERLEETLGVDRPSLPRWFKEKGIDLKKEPFEVTVSEFSSRRGGVYFRGSGILIDNQTGTNIGGLFAAGDCCTVSGGISGAAVMGYEAGKQAALFAGRNGIEESLQDQEIDAERERLLYPCNNGQGISPRDYEDKVRQIVTDHIGYQRTEDKLRTAIAELQALAAAESSLRAHDYHELMRAHEARNIREVAEMVATAALERRESRGSYSHFRADFPERDDANWRKMIVLRKDGAGYAVDYRSTALKVQPAETIHAHID
ncbi:MAG TPA: FAD-binding protein [Candidatus Binatia bacterium]|jgi:succinate dehydrogenase/fumarate reductase flavoprotein subunit